MKQAVKKTTYEDTMRHAEELFAALAETEEYSAAVSRAATLGLEVVTSVRHTYTADYADVYHPVRETEGTVPVGYAMELRFDLVRDGYVLAAADGSMQFSYTVTAIECMSVLFFHNLYFRDLDYILERNPISAMLEEYMDIIEEAGAVASPFAVGGILSAIPEERMAVVTRNEVTEGSYVEIACGAYTGTVGSDRSLYVVSDAFLPYRLFLHAVMHKTERFTDETLPLDREECEAFAEALEEAGHEVRHAATFADLYSELFESPLSPTPEIERLLDSLTVCRPRDFAADCETIAELLREQLEAAEEAEEIAEETEADEECLAEEEEAESAAALVTILW